MSVSNRSFRGKNLTYSDRPSSDLPENIGNRRSFEELKIPPDDVGNLDDKESVSTIVHDGLGNSVDQEPAHLQSGILSQFKAGGGRTNLRSKRDHALAPPAKIRPMQAPRSQSLPMPTHARGLDYMAHLTNEFTRLLRLRLGMPFSFSMKPITDGDINEPQLRASLDAIEKLLRDILEAATVLASVSFAEYRTDNHRFAVFYVSPNEKDSVKNKDLISALRQIVKLHATRNPPGQVNVLLVLANAQHVIEEHLYKLGAKKVLA